MGWQGELSEERHVARKTKTMLVSTGLLALRLEVNLSDINDASCVLHCPSNTLRDRRKTPIITVDVGYLAILIYIVLLL